VKNLSFVTRDKLTDYIESLIENNKIHTNKTSINPNSITECTRKLIYRTSTTTNEQDNCFAHLKKRWIKMLKDSTKVEIAVSEVLSDCNYNLSAVADAFIKINDKISVLKIQPVTEEDFNKVQNKGAIKKHVIDLMCQMWMAEIDDGILLYDDVFSCKYMVYHVTLYRPIIESIKRKALQLVDHQIKGTLPEKPYKDKNSEECAGCQFINKCWEK